MLVASLLEVIFGRKTELLQGLSTSLEGETLPGVNVLIQGTTTGTTTDIDGKYAINAPSTATLVYSFVGFVSRTVAVGNQSVIDINLELDVSTLEEVVVTAFGYEREKKAVTYAAQNVSTDELTKARPLRLRKGSLERLPVFRYLVPAAWVLTLR